MQLMGVVIVVAARFVVRRFALAPTATVRLGTGMTALGLAVVAELTLAAAFGGQSPAQSLANRNPVSGSVYLAMLMLFAAMPWTLARVHAA